MLMDIMRKLSFEVKGIYGTVNKYTSDSYITNIAKELINSVTQKNIEESIYLLEQIDIWYEKNQSEIQKNDYVMNKDSHLDIQSKIKDYLIELKKYSGEKNPRLDNIFDDNNKDQSITKKIFISHSSKDKKICDAFVDLLESIGIPEEIILYSSSERHGIPGDNDIFEYLKDHISGGITVYYMLSDNYYQSVYCLNEMGAAWIAKNDFSIFLLPNFEGSITGVINGNKKAYNINNMYSLIQFKNKLLETFDLTISETKWEDIKSKFSNALS
jgi:hypothetical protein